MPRNPKKLRVFGLADSLVPDIYEITANFPADERFGLISQMRRAAVSIPSNIVEGCARRQTNDYLRFLSIANGSAYELGYLIVLSARLGMMPATKADSLSDRSSHIAACLTALVDSLDGADDELAVQSRRKPKA